MSYKILIIDDEVDTLRLVGLTMKRQGYQVIGANSGLQGLELANFEDPDLIILDIMMPDIDGFEIARRLQSEENTSHIPILMFTAKSQMDDKMTGYEAGADDYITKPIHPSELVSHAEALISRKKERQIKEKATGHVMGVLAAKGGTGVSTLVYNLAIQLQQKIKENLLAVELNPGHGSWMLELNQPKIDGLKNLLHMNPGDVTEKSLREQLLKSSHGPYLLLSSYLAADIDLYRATEQVERILDIIPTLFPLSILDFGALYWSNYARLITRCDSILVVTEPYQPTLNMTGALLNHLREFSFGDDKPLIIASINRFRSSSAAPEQAMNDLLKQPVDTFISPIPKNVLSETIATGAPLVDDQPGSEFSNEITILANVICQKIFSGEKKELGT